MRDRTLFVCLFGGPGLGKSTVASGVHYRLKSLGINSEYIQEYAKDKTWQEDRFTLRCQPYITAKQLYRQYRVDGKVRVAVTDSPLLLGLAYPGFGCSPEWQEGIVKQFKLFRNLNILLQRNPEMHPYVEDGRKETEEEAIEKDAEVECILVDKGIPYVPMGGDFMDQIVDGVVGMVTSILDSDADHRLYSVVETRGSATRILGVFDDAEEARERMTDAMASSPKDAYHQIRELRIGGNE